MKPMSPNVPYLRRITKEEPEEISKWAANYRQGVLLVWVSEKSLRLDLSEQIGERGRVGVANLDLREYI